MLAPTNAAAVCRYAVLHIVLTTGESKYQIKLFYFVTVNLGVGYFLTIKKIHLHILMCPAVIILIH